MCHLYHGIHIIVNNIFCVFEVQIKLGDLYFYLLNLAILHRDVFVLFFVFNAGASNAALIHSDLSGQGDLRTCIMFKLPR